MKVLFTFALNEKYLGELSLYNTGDEFVASDKNEELAAEIVDTDLLVCKGSFSDRELLEKAEKLKWIQSWSAGVDGLLSDNVKDILREKNIILTNMSGVHVDSLGEQVIGYLIMFSRRLHELYLQQQEREWNRLRVSILKDKELLIVGTGAVGQSVGQRAKIFGMKVVGIKNDPSRIPAGFDQIYGPEELHNLLQRADYVVAAVPLTDQTENMFGQAEFAVMQDTAYFINIARGQVVVDAELIAALENNEIAGAALDVFREEPLPADSPFYDTANLIITPHTGGLFPQYNERAVSLLNNNLERFKTKNDLLNKINYLKGY